MAVTPSSDLKLLKCPIEIDNKNQLTFANATAQYNYFNSLTKIEATGYTYLRQNNVIRYNAHIDTLLEYNYVMYKNTNYSNKWFYAYITHMEYVSDSVTFIYIETDYYQTWMFDLTFKRSYVEREHVADDSVGKHTIDEGLSCGDYLQVSAPTDIWQPNLSNMKICVAITQMPNGDNVPAQQHSINGIYSGLIYAIFSHTSGFTTEVEWVNDFINMYDKNARAQAINSIFMVPKEFGIDPSQTGVLTAVTIPDSGNHFFYVPTAINSYVTIVNESSISLNSTLAESYTPVNNKLKCYPYNYLLVSNGAGIDTIYHYEDFTSNTPKFKVIGDITPGCSTKCVPLNYMKLSDSSSMNSYNYGVPGGKLPVCPWVNDAYTNWLVENGVSMAVNTIASIAEIAVGTGMIISGAGVPMGAGLIASGVGGVANTLTENYKASKTPDQANGNVSVGDVNYSAGKAGFTAYKLSIRKERAKAIDDYFSMFGYKVNTLKVPELNSRTKWNYIKTIDINITANIPQDDLQKIKDMFNTGITLWHDSSHFLDYSQTNSIVV